MGVGSSSIIDLSGLDQLIRTLAEQGFEVVGPTVRDAAIVYDGIGGVGDLPVGWTDEQEGGRYRLRRRDDGALFGYAVGPHSWKKYLFPPRNLLFKAHKRAGRMEFEEPQERAGPFAFIGVRACEVAAIEVQDRVFMGGSYVDPTYAERRREAFVVAVNCSTPASTCFCASMDAGPGVRSGYDLALTELLSPQRHVFLVEVGTERGEEILRLVDAEPAEPADSAAAGAVVDSAAARMGRSMDTGGIKELLERNREHPRWDEVADRCLSCANCTLVCPTCFCSTVEDVTDLSAEHAERWRRWDSCFALEFSHAGQNSIRTSTRARYRQWMTHKLGTWIDQFDSSGCVGCGRCITWCPVGIDITEEVAAIRHTDGATSGDAD